VSFNKRDVEQSIATRFEQQVTQHGDRIAVATRREKISYIALNAAANHVGRAILRLRGESNEPIAVLLQNDIATVAAILGILKAGKICVPMDPTNPEARTALILQDCGAQLILTNSKYVSIVDDLIGSRREVLNVEEIDSRLPTENLALAVSRDRLAYIIYTSGSMGLPKGVVHTQRNVLHNAMRYTHGCEISAQDRVILLASLSTGQGTPTALSALLNGAALYPFNLREEGLAGLSSWLKSESITVYISTPSVFRHLVQSLRAEEEFPELRIIRLGSERILESDVELYRRYFSNYSTFVIFYSATEAGNISQCLINRDTAISGSVIPAGYPADDMEVRY
jgi:acyl-CoA synthetase (AMP-forming)/AMP-acid ligase II